MRQIYFVNFEEKDVFGCWEKKQWILVASSGKKAIETVKHKMEEWNLETRKYNIVRKTTIENYLVENDYVNMIGR